MSSSCWPPRAERRGALIPVAAALLATACTVAMATGLRERAARRASVEAADLGRVLSAGCSALCEAVASLRASTRGHPPVEAMVEPARLRAAIAADEPWLSIGRVEVKPVRASSPAARRAGAVPHGVLELAVRVQSSRGGARTVRRRYLYYFSKNRTFSLVGEPLATVVE